MQCDDKDGKVSEIGGGGREGSDRLTSFRGILAGLGALRATHHIRNAEMMPHIVYSRGGRDHQHKISFILDRECRIPRESEERSSRW